MGQHEAAQGGTGTEGLRCNDVEPGEGAQLR